MAKELSIDIHAGAVIMGFGCEYDCIDTLDSLVLEEVFWENYDEFEAQLKEIVANCKLKESYYSSHSEYKESVATWARSEAEALFKPFAIESRVDGTPADVRLPFDVKEAFLTLVSKQIADTVLFDRSSVKGR